MRKRETRKAMTRYAWESVNVPAIRCLPAMCRGCGNANRKAGGAKK